MAHAADDVKVKVAGDKVTGRIVDHLSIPCEQLGCVFVQRLAGLEMQLLGNLFAGGLYQDVRARMAQWQIAAANEQVKNGSFKGWVEVTN
jgi:hypothetical protein